MKMKKVLGVFFIGLIFILASCVDIRPFHIGGNIDAQSQLKNIPRTMEIIKEMSKDICPFVVKNKVAIIDFIKYKEDEPNGNGRFLAYELTKMLNRDCLTYAVYIGFPEWFSAENYSLKICPSNYDYVIVGSYRYMDKIFFIYISLIDTRLKSEVKTFSFTVSVKKRNFSIEPLNIPNYLEFP